MSARAKGLALLFVVAAIYGLACVIALLSERIDRLAWHVTLLKRGAHETPHPQ
jgi:hypothetical protein